MSKILIVGNHCCSNRGDAAILRGLLDYLEKYYPSSDISFTTRYVDSAKWFFDQKVLKDPLEAAKKKTNGLKGKLENVFINKVVFPLYCAGRISNKRLLPKVYRDFSASVAEYDLVIQVGGSFFVDLYGAAQFETAAICIKENIPIVMLGHSVGPFKLNNTEKIAKMVFKNCTGLVLREKSSEEHLSEIGLTNKDFINGVDTAWLIEPKKYCKEEKNIVPEYFFSRPCIAITTRELSPFDKRLGITQVEYEKKMASLCLDLINDGYNVIAASTCTGLDSYHKDDRMCALRIASLIGQPKYYFPVMDELTDIELGQLFSKCDLLIGTRLHSAILSMRFGTPAFAIYYEHKSLGVLAQLGMREYSIDIHDIDSKKFKNKISKTLKNLTAEVLRVNENVANEALHCELVMNEILNPILRNNC